ncbi:MAG: tRNA (adenosine(37)-N6)-threonylcarbamoyltransferase complex ATPase subunit type 1 TsaE [Cyclobacteriaceae bacterium]|nr:tRNA (adenosine(37)-N6)-threonylcarbamoyltransferase complex ATPase subunit type 1 TsaE [Cyclobacteriaceae bacterium]
MPDGWRLTSQGPEISLAGLDQVARELIAHSDNRKIWLFYGEMGAGKTTLIKAIARQLGVQEPMSSPTFSLVNEYVTPSGPVYHVDLYRLQSEREILDIGMEEYFSSGAHCLVEWPEKLGSIAPEQAMRVRLTPTDAQHRKIEFEIV